MVSCSRDVVIDGAMSRRTAHQETRCDQAGEENDQIDVARGKIHKGQVALLDEFQAVLAGDP